jgi:hypothetical protein
MSVEHTAIISINYTTLRKSQKGFNLVLMKLELLSYRINGINATISVELTVMLENHFQVSTMAENWILL